MVNFISTRRFKALPSLVELLITEKNPQQLRENILSRDHVMLPISEGDYSRWVKLSAQRIMSIFDTLVELYDTDALNCSGKLELNKLQGIQIGDLLNQAGMKWKGASELQVLSSVVWPLARLAVYSSAATVFILSFSDFIYGFFCSGAGSTTLPVFLYSSIKFRLTPAVSCVFSVMLLLAGIAGLLWYFGPQAGSNGATNERRSI